MSEELKAIRERHERDEKMLELLRGASFYEPGPRAVTPAAHTDRATLLSALSAYQARAEAAEARVGELEAALKPFAHFQQASVVSYRNYSDADHFYTFNDTSITVGDLRNATRTLKGTPDDTAR